MRGLKARVRNGRLILDEPTTLPEGTELDLVIDDGGDDLSDEEREKLHRFLEKSMASAESGRFVPASKVLNRLRKRP
jgi:hypothetical protein